MVDNFAITILLRGSIAEGSAGPRNHIKAWPVGQAEIYDFYPMTGRRNKDIGRLQIAVYYLMRVEISYSIRRLNKHIKFCIATETVTPKKLIDMLTFNPLFHNTPAYASNILHRIGCRYSRMIKAHSNLIFFVEKIAIKGYISKFRSKSLKGKQPPMAHLTIDVSHISGLAINECRRSKESVTPNAG